MAPDFDAIDFGADVICMVDHPVRQPKEPLLDDLQRVRHELDLSFVDRDGADYPNKFRAFFKGGLRLDYAATGAGNG